MHMDTATCITEEPHQKYRLGTVSNRLLVRGGGGLNMFYWIPNPCPLLLQSFITFSPYEGFPVKKHGKQSNHE